MKKMIFWMTVVGVVMLFSAAALCATVTIKCTVADGNPIYSTSPTLATEGWLVQVITADSSAVSSPDANGNPTGTNYLTTVPAPMAKAIGSSPEADCGAGEFYTKYFKPSVATNKWIFIRVWNGTTVLLANKYGNSIPVQVPAGTSFTYTPESFSINLPKPGPAGPTGFIGTGESGTSIKWSWNPYSGAIGYNLYEVSGELITSTTNEVTTVEASLTAYNKPYARYLKAVLTGGLTNQSNQYTAYTMANVPSLSPLTSGWNAASTNHVTAVWTNGDNPGGTKYRLQRNGSPVGTPITGLTATDANLTANTLYHYNVIALNGNNTSTTPSNSRDATTPPGKPALTVTGYTTKEITWSWVPGVSGANSYNFYISSLCISTTEVSRKTIPLDPCGENTATVEAVSAANGTGEPAALSKWTKPVVPPQPTGHASAGTSKAVDLDWPGDTNANAIYSVQYSGTSSTDGFVTPDANVLTKSRSGLVMPQGSTSYWFRINARNQNSPADYSGYSTPVWLTSSSDTGGGGGGIAPTISNVKFNGRVYRLGAVISSRPHITATVTGEVDTSFTSGAVFIDQGLPGQMIIPGTDVTYETAPELPPGAWQLSVRVSDPIPATPVSSHTLRIYAKNLTGAQTIWEGVVGVMSGGVQMIGSAYNYPNPFRPLSSDTNQNTTRISYNLSVDATVTLIIYDISGHEVYRKTARSGTDGGQAGLNSVPFSGKSMFGEALGNGMYLYKLISGGSVIGSGKLVVLD